MPIFHQNHAQTADVKTCASEKAECYMSCNFHQVQLTSWLEKVKFKKRLFGGVDEKDVWEKIEELNTLYEAALKAEQIRYSTLLQTACQADSFPSASLDKEAVHAQK